jgi:hypothetical protein
MAVMGGDWQQALFDLMANKKIKLVVEGEMGEVDALLCVRRDGIDALRGSLGGHWEEVASVVAAETFADAMRELMERVKA